MSLLFLWFDYILVLYGLTKICTNKIMLAFYYQLLHHTNIASLRISGPGEYGSLAINVFVMLGLTIDAHEKITDFFSILQGVCKHRIFKKGITFISRQYQKEFSLSKLLQFTHTFSYLMWNKWLRERFYIRNSLDIYSFILLSIPWIYQTTCKTNGRTWPAVPFQR